MTISKTIAETIAMKLCEKKYKEYEIAKKTMKETIEKAYITKIPKDILAFYKKYPKMVESTQSVGINRGNYIYFSSYFSKPLPEINRILDTIFTQSEKDEFFKMEDTAKQLKRDYDNLTKEVQTALLNLKTSKRIADNFPEATPYLPTSDKMELAIDLTTIRQKIK